jgi:DNA-binding cell septation regulator SpoVG
MMNYDVRVNKIQNPKTALVGFATLVIEDAIEIKGFKIFSGKSGLFCKNPSEKQTKDGEEKYFDTVWFLGDKAEGTFTTELQAEIFDQMLAAYNDQEERTQPTRAAAGRANVEAARPQAPPAPAKKVARPSFK